MPIIAVILIALAACAAGAVVGFMYRKKITELKIGRAEQYANDLLNDATRKAEEQRKEKILEAKEEVLRLKSDLDREIHDRRAEQQRSERRGIVASQGLTFDRGLVQFHPQGFQGSQEPFQPGIATPVVQDLQNRARAFIQHDRPPAPAARPRQPDSPRCARP